MEGNSFQCNLIMFQCFTHDKLIYTIEVYNMSFAVEYYVQDIYLHLQGHIKYFGYATIFEVLYIVDDNWKFLLLVIVCFF